MSAEPACIGRLERLLVTVGTVTGATAAQQADHQESHITVRGTRVRMLTAGSGDPLLYLHGSGDLGMWQPALTELAKTHRVHRPDHPGFSGSDDKDGID